MGTEAANKAFSAYVGLDKPEKKSKAKAEDEPELPLPEPEEAESEATKVDRSDHPNG
jgi:hypothetical protein